MRNLKLKSLMSISIFFITSTTFAANSSSIKFFISNNTHEISIEKAYERLSNSSQDELENGTINILQNNHVEQGRFENILGTYEMASDKNTTGDNTAIFLASPYQHFSDDQIFSVARQLANAFQQESIAIFISSNQSPIADVVVNFTSNKPSIAEAIKLIHKKLPAYANAFSLHLNNTHSAFKDAKVHKIEWLGSRVNINEIKKAFLQDVVSYSHGQAYLVYKNGQIEAI